MKAFLIICSGLLFLAVADLPSGYYIILRLVITVCAVLVVVKEYKDHLTFWMIAFGLLAIIFNPIFPVHLHDRSAWMPIDITGGVLCLTRAMTYERMIEWKRFSFSRRKSVSNLKTWANNYPKNTNDNDPLCGQKLLIAFAAAPIPEKVNGNSKYKHIYQSPDKLIIENIMFIFFEFDFWMNDNEISASSRNRNIQKCLDAFTSVCGNIVSHEKLAALFDNRLHLYGLVARQNPDYMSDAVKLLRQISLDTVKKGFRLYHDPRDLTLSFNFNENSLLEVRLLKYYTEALPTLWSLFALLVRAK